MAAAVRTLLRGFFGELTNTGLNTYKRELVL